jgi:hypothetical protein
MGALRRFRYPVRQEVTLERRLALPLVLSLVLSPALALAAPCFAAAAPAAASGGSASETAPQPRPVVQRIDLSLRDADLVEVLRSFARLGGFNLVIDPGPSSTPPNRNSLIPRYFRARSSSLAPGFVC